jgi:hypothetical protein
MSPLDDGRTIVCPNSMHLQIFINFSLSTINIHSNRPDNQREFVFKRAHSMQID